MTVVLKVVVQIENRFDREESDYDPRLDELISEIESEVSNLSTHVPFKRLVSGGWIEEKSHRHSQYGGDHPSRRVYRNDVVVYLDDRFVDKFTYAKLEVLKGWAFRKGFDVWFFWWSGRSDKVALDSWEDFILKFARTLADVL